MTAADARDFSASFTWRFGRGERRPLRTSPQPREIAGISHPENQPPRSSGRIIIGGRSASYEMLPLSRRAPAVMVLPKVVDTRIQPIAIKDDARLSWWAACLIQPQQAEL